GWAVQQWTSREISLSGTALPAARSIRRFATQAGWWAIQLTPYLRLRSICLMARAVKRALTAAGAITVIERSIQLMTAPSGIRRSLTPPRLVSIGARALGRSSIQIVVDL